jgi:pimeloyl-ACP methyl ester carboxylesterase
MSVDLDANSTSKVADIGWIKIHYHDVGAGEPVVLLHGGGPGASSWSNFVLNIGALAEHFRVIALDMPGYGKSGPIVIKDEPRPDVSARAVRDVLDVLGLERAHVVGNSMGGATALTYAVNYPERTGKVVMMGAAPIGQGLMFTPMLPTYGIRALFDVFMEPTFESFRKMFDLMVYDSSSVPDDVLKARVSAMDETHRRNFIESMSGAQRNLLPELPNVDAPVLLIHGRNDTMCPLELSLALLPLLKNSQLHVFNKCGHWAQYEHAEKFNRMVVDFLTHDD